MTTQKSITMSPDEYEHNIKVLTAITEIKTLQKVSNSEFMAHKDDDKEAFDRINASIRALVKTVGQNASNFRVFQTKVLYAVMGAITVGTVLGTVLNILLTGSRLVS